VGQEGHSKAILEALEITDLDTTNVQWYHSTIIFNT